MSSECDKCGGCAYDYPRCYCRFGSAPVKTDEEILQCLEDVFIRLRHIKQYVCEQKERIEKGYQKEELGYYALRYLNDVLLAFVKENEDDSVTPPSSTVTTLKE